MIVARGLVKQYDGRVVVNELDLHVRQGEIYGFLGPNGAGKSTTIKMILGLLPPTRGSVMLFGRTLARDYVGIKRRIGVVGEVQHFYGEMTGLEYLSFFADLFGVGDKKRIMRDLLARVDLTGAEHLPLRAYSKGMQQKMALVRALVHDPDLLILDEPVSSMDPHGIKQIRDIINEENRKGKTFLISSHLLSEIEKTCHRVGIIDHGRLIAEDTMDGIRGRISAGMRIEIEIAGEGSEVKPALAGLAFVESVSCRERLLIIQTRDKADHRAEISRYLADCGCLVLGMTSVQMTLEQAFVTLTEHNVSMFAEGR